MRTPTIALSLAALATLAGCRGQAAAPSEGEPPAGIESRLSFTEAQPATERTLTRLLGQVVTPPEARLTLSPTVEARVVEWAVRVGDRVAAGDALATLSSPALVDLAAAVDEKKAVAAERARVVRRLKTSVEAGFRASEVLYAAELARDEARADLERARRRLAAHDGELQAEERGRTWTASVGGLVTAIDCPAGGTYGPADRCVTLVADDALRVQVDVAEHLVARLGDATPSARWTATGGAGQTLTFERRAADFDGRSRTRRFYFTGPDLVPGASGIVELGVPPPPAAVRLPRMAVVDVQGEATVFVGDAQPPRPVAVTLVGRQGPDALVLGIPPGQRVVARGAFALKSALAFE